MTTRATLKDMVMLGYLTDDMLDQLIPIAEMRQFDENELVFNQGEKADRFFFVQQGKVLLEQRISPTISITLSAINPRYSFEYHTGLTLRLLQIPNFLFHYHLGPS